MKRGIFQIASVFILLVFPILGIGQEYYFPQRHEVWKQAAQD